MKQQRNGGLPRKGSRSSRTRGQLSGARCRKSPDLDRCAASSQAGNCHGDPAVTSPSRGPRATRRGTSGQDWRRRRQTHTGPSGYVVWARMEDDTCHLPRPFAGTKREISGGKWTEGVAAGGYKIPGAQRTNGAVARCAKRLAGRFHQLEKRQCLQWTRIPGPPQVRVVLVHGADAGEIAQILPALGAAAGNPVGGRSGRDGKGKRSRDEQCTRYRSRSPESELRAGGGRGAGKG